MVTGRIVYASPTPPEAAPFQRIKFPAATAFLIKYLTDVTAYVVSDGIPDDATTFVKVRRGGGPETPLRIVDAPQMIIECYAPFEDDAEDLCEDIRSWVNAMAGRVIDGVSVKRVVNYGGPVSLPDDRSPDLSRFTFNVALHIRGTTTE